MSLKTFVQDKTTFDEVFTYLTDYVDAYALKKVYRGEDVSGIKDAVEILKNAKHSLLVENTEIKNTKIDRAL